MSLILEHYTHLCYTFRERFVLTARNFHMEDIHQLRVSTKKIKANLSFFEQLSGQSFSKKEHLRMLQPMFKEAGYLREIQVNLALIDQFDQQVLSEYMEYMRASSGRLVRILDEKMTTFSFNRWDQLNQKVHIELKDISRHQASDTLTQFIHLKLEKANRLTKDIKDSKKLHKIRVHLKMVTEAARIMAVLKPSEYLSAFRYGLKEFTDLLGNWHDHDVLLISMKSFLESEKVNHPKKIKDLIRHLEKQNELVKSGIGKQLLLSPLHYHPPEN